MPALQTANYVNFDIPLKFKISLSKLESSVHNLNVETGRHVGTPYEQRLCTLCDNGAVGDEYHFVMICPVYQKLRSTYLPQVVSENIT